MRTFRQTGKGPRPMHAWHPGLRQYLHCAHTASFNRTRVGSRCSKAETSMSHGSGAWCPQLAAPGKERRRSVAGRTAQTRNQSANNSRSVDNNSWPSSERADGCAIKNRTDRLHSISAAIHKIVMIGPSAARPYRIIDLIPENWEGSIEKDEFRNWTAALLLRMQARSDQGEEMPVRVERVD